MSQEYKSPEAVIQNFGIYTSIALGAQCGSIGIAVNGTPDLNDLEGILTDAAFEIFCNADHWQTGHSPQ
jgi:hypothetical protein